MVFDKSNMLVYIIKSATDLCGNTITNSGVGSANDEAGFSNGALDLENNDYLEFDASVGKDIATALNNDATIIYDVNLDTTMGSQSSYVILGQWSGAENQRSFIIGGSEFLANDSYWISISSDKVSFTNYPSASGKVGFNEWSNYIVTCDGSSKEVFKDGTSIHTASTINANAVSTNKFRIGRRTDAANTGFKGKINNIQIHKKVLSKAHQHFAIKWGNKKRIA